MNRKLTPYEMDILRIKCLQWSYGVSIINGFIELGNGHDEDGVTALLPYELLMDNNIGRVEPKHTLKPDSWQI